MPASGVSGIGCDARARRERERRRDVVQRPLRHGLQERKDRRRERRRDARHLDPDQPVADARHGLVGDASDDPQPRAEIQLVELPGGAWLAVATEELELLRLEIEDGRLVVLFGGREVQRVADAGIDRQAIGQPPVVLDEVLLEVGAIADLLLLEVDRELLHLSEQEARERRARVRRAREIAEQVAEGEGPGRRRRLQHIEALPPQVRTHLDRVPALQPGERVGDLGHAGAEVCRGVRRRSELLIAADEKRRQGIGKLRASHGMPGRFSADDAERAELAPRFGRPPGACRRCGARSAACSRTCADSWRRTTTTSCPAAPACPS